MQQNQDIKGFTLLELLVVITIVIIISAVGYPKFSSWKKDREVRVASENIANMIRDRLNTGCNASMRELIVNLNKSSFNNKKRFVLIDNIELLNLNSINALLKILEEPNENINFILINNNKRVLSTLKSRCLNFKVFLTRDQSIKIVNKLLNDDINTFINNKLFDYYATPGKLFKLIKFSEEHVLDIANFDLN